MIITKLREKMNKTFGKGVCYPVSKLNKHLDMIVKYQNEKMIEYEEYPVVAETFMRELAMQFEEAEAERQIQRSKRYGAFMAK